MRLKVPMVRHESSYGPRNHENVSFIDEQHIVERFVMSR